MTMSSNLGMPVAVDAAVIDQELTSMWKTEDESEKAAIRACSCNLVVIAHDREECELLPELLARVAEWHPCRSLIAFREDEDPAPELPGSAGMRAWIHAQCSVSPAGGPQTCCETVTVGARGRSVSDLPNILVSLLVPDLPVFLYWRSFWPEDRELAEKTARFADLLIVDSHASKDDPQNRERLLSLLTSAPEGLSVRDLNWSRLTAWRDLIAQFFDPPSLRRYAREISEVEILRTVGSPSNIPTRTLLLTGWLASRLNWRRTSVGRQDGQWISHWNGPGGEVVVRFIGMPVELNQTPGISSIILRARSGPSFTVVREKGSSCITASSEGIGPVLVHSVIEDARDEAGLLIRELSLAGHDHGFRQVLTEVLALEQSFGEIR
jgi:glucose-6-phosphate dehydrogenase assembly protein OpcA